MNNLKLLLFILVCFLQNGNSQTLIMNEVSNGPSGNQEYVEFVVVSNTATYTCNSPTPPCIDIREWIFDDNSGYHGASGIATGAVRFANNPIWACVPLGTIILIYNNADRNIAIPPDDLSMIDGNCTIIAPMNSNLFESNATTPGAVACSYPAVGWTLGGNWNNTVFANVGDCARIVNLAGCEVFSVCWGSDNLNNLIYFPVTAAQRVYYFNDTNPLLQSNWTNGSASPSPGNQTSGAPNNALNAAYIAQFNNGCLPITSISVTATSVNAGCSCTGSATANAIGSIGGYTYLWSDGQTSASAIGLCAGIYTVTATSHIGCSVSTTVAITSSPSTTVTVNSQTICVGNSTILTANPSVLGGTYVWLPGGQTTQAISVSPLSTTTYSVIYSLFGCTTSTIASVIVNPLPIVTVNSQTICAGQSALLTAAGASTYVWNTGSILNPLTVSPLATTSYTVIGTSVSGCTNTAVSSVIVNPSPTVTVNSQTICTGQTALLIATGATSYLWSNGSTTNSISITPVTTTSYFITGTLLSCSKTLTTNVVVIPLPVLSVPNQTICEGQQATITVTSFATSYTWSNGLSGNPILISPLISTSYSVTGSIGVCSATATVKVFVNSSPFVNFKSNLVAGCAPLCVNFSDLSTVTSGSISSWNWQFESGSTSNLQNPIHCFNSPGSYSISLFVMSTNGCSKSITKPNMITVYPVPVAEFTTDVFETDELNPIINFINQSTNAVSYTWSFGDLTTSYQINPMHSFIQAGNYTTTLTAISNHGCKDIISHSIKVNGMFTFYAPNTFTPNEDNINDKFLPMGTGWDENKYVLNIFDRWGDLCFSTNDVKTGWDGKANKGSEVAQMDTYTWKVELSDIFGKQHKYIGRITIVE